MRLMPVVLAVSVVVAVVGLWKGAPPPASTAPAAIAGADRATARPAPSEASLTLSHDSAAALRADNAELSERIAELERQRDDAEHLIQLKTARLQALEKASAGQ